MNALDMVFLPLGCFNFHFRDGCGFWAAFFGGYSSAIYGAKVLFIETAG